MEIVKGFILNSEAPSPLNYIAPRLLTVRLIVPRTDFFLLRNGPGNGGKVKTITSGGLQ